MRVVVHCRKALRSGIPSVFNELKPLYRQAGKGAVIEALVLSYINTLKATGALPAQIGAAAAAEAAKEVPTIVMWTLLLAARVR